MKHTLVVVSLLLGAFAAGVIAKGNEDELVRR